MVTTPTIWKPEFRTNEITNSEQFDGVLADMGGGRFVSVWTDFDGSVASPGINLVGQIFDTEGSALGDPFQVNQAVKTGHQEDGAVASRPGGGFAVAYKSYSTSITDVSIPVDFFDTNGNRTGGATVQADTNDDVLSAPSIAAGTDGGYVVVYSRKVDADGTFDIVSRHIKANGTVDAEQSVFDSTDTSAHAAEVAALTNGNYVVAFIDLANPGDRDPEFKIVGQNGAIPGPAGGKGFQISTALTDETDVQVAALTGGGFVVAWVGKDGDSSGIRYSVYNANGTAVKANQFGGGFGANATTAGVQSGADVAGLKDGGFVIVWRDTERNGTYGQRFDASGDKVGGEFLAAGSGRTSSIVAALDDGRFVTGTSKVIPNSDVFATIFDPRETTISGDGDDNVITSRIEGATVNGLGGDDELLGQAGKDRLNGGDGRDRLKGGEGKDKLTGGGDKDTFVFDFAVKPKKAANTHKDKVLDFSHKADTVELDGDVFTQLKLGKVKNKDFDTGTDKASTDGHTLYWHEKSGKLYYDTNGSKKGGDVEIAKFNKDADLAANDFLVT